MKILVNGPSVSRGPGSWPYLIEQHYNAEVVNLSQAGAGNGFIQETTTAEIAQRPYDLVLIQWADLRRIDVKVKNVDYFDDTIYTSKHQKLQNDWPEKIVEPFNDQDLVPDDWVFGCGYINTKDPSLVELFDSLYKHTDNNGLYFNSLIKMISLQAVLKAQQIPYVFCFVRTLARLERFGYLYDMLDTSAMITTATPHTFATELNSWEPDKLHPGLEAHSKFAQTMIAKINERLSS